DDKFFMYYEETEWCVRATRAGFKIALVPMSMIWHKISIEERATSPRTYYYMVRNRLLFLNKTGAGYQTWTFTVLEYIRTYMNWTLLEKRHDRRHLRKPMLEAFRDYSRGHFGQQTT